MNLSSRMSRVDELEVALKKAVDTGAHSWACNVYEQKPENKKCTCWIQEANQILNKDRLPKSPKPLIFIDENSICLACRHTSDWHGQKFGVCTLLNCSCLEFKFLPDEKKDESKSKKSKDTKKKN